MRKDTHKPRPRLIVRKCHKCGQVVESYQEEEKCLSCGKSFLPLNYFAKIHDHEQSKYHELYAKGHELNDEDLIKGIFVLW